MAGKIIDCFPYFDQTGKEILELRINLLKDYVDAFVICESNKTQSGIPIEFELKNTIDKLGLPKDKIKIIELNIPDDDNLEILDIDKHNCYEGNSSNINSLRARARERMQKDAIRLVLNFFDDDSTFILSDIDEIINPDNLSFFTSMVKKFPEKLIKIPLVHLEGRADLRVYNKSTGNPRMWDGAMIICNKQHLQQASPTQMRSNVFNPFEIAYIHHDNKRIEDAGWHFSWMGSAKTRKDKCKAFTHYNDTFSFLGNQNYSSSTIHDFLEQEPEEGTMAPSGDQDTVLKKYPINNLPKKLFELERVRNFLMPNWSKPKEYAFYIFSPWFETGGPEALHQLCGAINSNGMNAFMYYYQNEQSIEKNIMPDSIIPKYFNYNVKPLPQITIDDLDKDNAIIIIPEVFDRNIFPNNFRANLIYWFLGCQGDYSDPSLLKYYLGCQSQCALDLLHNIPSIPKDKIFALSDYTREQFIHSEHELENTHRENIILYNPKKGFEHIEKIITTMPVDYSFIPIENMSTEQMIELGLKAKIYLDFGKHPGKDRIPREMASLGCVVITGNENTAGNDIDVPLSNNYKFTLNTVTNQYNYEAICLRIFASMINYNNSFYEQLQYRNIIRKEKQVFYEEVKKMINIVTDGVKTVPNEYICQLHNIPKIDQQPLKYIMEVLKIQKDKNDLWLEFGTGWGESINYISQFTDDIVYSFDSFEGLPEHWRDMYPIGAFSMNKQPPKVNNNVRLIEGMFQETLQDFLNQHPQRQISFMHLDADLYSSTKYVLDCVKNRIKPGCVIVFDELLNYDGFDNDRGELLAWYEFINENNVKYRWIGMNGEFGTMHPLAEKVAILIESIG